MTSDIFPDTISVMSSPEGLPSQDIRRIAQGLRGENRIDLSARATLLSAELEERPSQMVVVTGFAALTPLGNTEETRRKELLGETAARTFQTNITDVTIAAHTQFNPLDHFKGQQMVRISKLSAMMLAVAREAAMHAGILDEKGKLKPEFHRDTVGTNIATGFGNALNVIDTFEKIHNPDPKVRPSAYNALQIFPEQSNAGVAQGLSISGWGSSSGEACASGLSSVAEANLLIRSGKNRIMLAGGFEDVFSGTSADSPGHPELAFTVFNGLTALSKNNDNPQEASRPFDRKRDGFVMASGGGVMVLESLESALERGAPIYATILGAEKGMDGHNPTNPSTERVARLLLKTLKDKEGELYYPVDAVFAHATSTPAGDKAEIEAFRNAFGELLPQIPITAIKSIHGHLLGGAGAINGISAIRSLHEGVIPPTINLTEREEGMEDLDIVTAMRRSNPQTILATAYGFGGYDAAVLFGKYS